MADELNKDNTAENSANKENSYAAAKELYEQHIADKKKAKQGIFTQFAAEQQDYTVLTDAADGNDIAVKDGNVIVIETGAYNPKLDPSSAEFDAELYEAKLKEHGKDITTIKDSLAASFEQLAERVKDVYTKEELQSALLSLGQTMQALQETIYPVADGIKSILGSDSFHSFIETANAIKANMPTLEEIAYYNKFFIALEYIANSNPAYKELTLDDIEAAGTDADGNVIQDSLFEQAIADAHIFVEAMEIELQKPKYKNYDFNEIKADGIAADGTLIKGSLLEKLLKATEKALKAQISVSTKETDLERIKHIPLKEIKAPLDKTSGLFFSLNPPTPQKDINGQLQFIPVSVGNDKHPATVYYSYYVDSDLLKKLGIPNKFTQKDFTICSVINSFRDAGNNIITLTQLHKALGNRTKPNSKQLETLQNNLTRLLTTTIKLDTKDIAEAYNIENYNEFLGSLLPIQIIDEKRLLTAK